MPRARAAGRAAATTPLSALTAHIDPATLTSLTHALTQTGALGQQGVMFPLSLDPATTSALAALPASTTESLAGAFLMTLANKLRGCSCEACTVLRENAIALAPDDGTAAGAAGAAAARALFSQDTFMLGRGPYHFHWGGSGDASTDVRAFACDVLKRRFAARRVKARTYMGTSTFSVPADGSSEVPLHMVMDAIPPDAAFSTSDALPVYIKLPISAPPAELPLSSEGVEMPLDWLHVFVPLASRLGSYGPALPRASLVMHIIDSEEHYEMVVRIRRDAKSRRLRLHYVPLTTALVGLKYPFDGWPATYQDLVTAAEDVRAAAVGPAENAAAAEMFSRYLWYVRTGEGAVTPAPAAEKKGRKKGAAAASAAKPATVLYGVPVSSAVVPACMGQVLHIAEHCYPALLEVYSARMSADAATAARAAVDTGMVPALLSTLIHHCPGLAPHASAIGKVPHADFITAGETVPPSVSSAPPAVQSVLAWVRLALVALCGALYGDTGVATGTDALARALPLRLFAMAVLLIGRTNVRSLPALEECPEDTFAWPDTVCQELYESLDTMARTTVTPPSPAIAAAAAAAAGGSASAAPASAAGSDTVMAAGTVLRPSFAASVIVKALRAIRAGVAAMDNVLESVPSGKRPATSFQIVQTAVRMMLPASPRIWKHYVAHHPQFALLHYEREDSDACEEWQKAEFDPDGAAHSDLMATPLTQVAVGNDRSHAGLPALYFDPVTGISYGSLADVVPCATCGETSGKCGHTAAAPQHTGIRTGRAAAALTDGAVDDGTADGHDYTGEGQDDVSDEHEHSGADEDEDGLPPCGHEACRKPKTASPATSKFPTATQAVRGNHAKHTPAATTSSSTAARSSGAPATAPAASKTATMTSASAAAAASGASSTLPAAGKATAHAGPAAAPPTPAGGQDKPHPIATAFVTALNHVPEAVRSTAVERIKTCVQPLLAMPEVSKWLRLAPPAAHETDSPLQHTERLLSFSLDVLEAAQRASVTTHDKLSRIPTLTARIDELRQRLASNTDKNAELQRRIKEIELRFKELDPRIAELRERMSQLDVAGQAYKDLQQRIRDDRARMAAIEAERSRLRSLISATRGAATSTSEQLVAGEKTLQAHLSRISKLQQDISGGGVASEEAEGLRAELDDLNKRTAEAEAALKGHEASAQEVQAVAEKILADVSNTEAATADADAAAEDAEARLLVAQAAVADAVQELTGTKANTAKLEADVARMRAQIVADAKEEAGGGRPTSPDELQLTSEEEAALCVRYEARLVAMQDAIGKVARARDEAQLQLQRQQGAARDAPASTQAAALTKAQMELQVARELCTRELAALDASIAEQQKALAVSAVAVSQLQAMMQAQPVPPTGIPSGDAATAYASALLRSQSSFGPAAAAATTPDSSKLDSQDAHSSSLLPSSLLDM